MELFLLIALGITVISFISIVLTKPTPAKQQKLLPEPAQAEFVVIDEAKPRHSSNDQEDIIVENLEVEALELTEEEVLVPIA